MFFTFIPILFRYSFMEPKLGNESRREEKQTGMWDGGRFGFVCGGCHRQRRKDSIDAQEPQHDGHDITNKLLVIVLCVRTQAQPEVNLKHTGSQHVNVTIRIRITSIMPNQNQIMPVNDPKPNIVEI